MKYDSYRLLCNNLWIQKIEDSKINYTQKKIANTKEEMISIAEWPLLYNTISNCKKCKLNEIRNNVVIERGSCDAKWLFVGEAPGEEEDKQAKPFVGRSGKLLDKMIEAMKLDIATDVYICNVIKCRPPANRNPQDEEIKLCKNYLIDQINLVNPKIIITLGQFATKTLLETDMPIGKLRSKQHLYKNIPVIVTYHPAYLLRNPSAKPESWKDLQLAMSTFNKLNTKP